MQVRRISILMILGSANESASLSTYCVTGAPVAVLRLAEEAYIGGGSGTWDDPYQLVSVISKEDESLMTTAEAKALVNSANLSEFIGRKVDYKPEAGRYLEDFLLRRVR